MSSQIYLKVTKILSFRFLASSKVLHECPSYLVPIWERARSQPDKNTACGSFQVKFSKFKVITYKVLNVFNTR